MKIAIDIMGGDFAPGATVAGSILAQKELPAGAKIVMIGDEKLIEAQLKELGASASSRRSLPLCFSALSL